MHGADPAQRFRGERHVGGLARDPDDHREIKEIPVVGRRVAGELQPARDVTLARGGAVGRVEFVRVVQREDDLHHGPGQRHRADHGADAKGLEPALRTLGGRQFDADRHQAGRRRHHHDDQDQAAGLVLGGDARRDVDAGLPVHLDQHQDREPRGRQVPRHDRAGACGKGGIEQAQAREQDQAGRDAGRQARAPCQRPEQAPFDRARLIELRSCLHAPTVPGATRPGRMPTKPTGREGVSAAPWRPSCARAARPPASWACSAPPACRWGSAGRPPWSRSATRTGTSTCSP